VAQSERWRVALPVVLLIAVASSQIVLSRTSQLSPWKGGGFGMFSSLDSGSFRFVRLFAEAPERSEELELSPSLEDLAARAALLPSDRRLERLARATVAREQRRGQPVASVRVEVWRNAFAPGSLRSSEERLRAFTWRVTP
jgi:hypothetical protein